MSSFSWAPFYSELAQAVLQYEMRQTELLDFLREVQNAGIKVGNLHDKTASGNRELDEIDPFTFFATFNRGGPGNERNRNAILERIRTELNITSPLPTDFDGIPTVDNRLTHFFAAAESRKADDIPCLWKLAKAAVGRRPSDLPMPLFSRALSVKAVKMAKLTIGLFWLDPKNYLPCDKVTLAYLGKSRPDTHAEYVALVDEVVRQRGHDFVRISADAWRDWLANTSDTPRAGEATQPNPLPPRTWTEGSRQQVTANRYERVTDATIRAACLEAHGTCCWICGFNFRVVYGELGNDFIYLHHRIPVAIRAAGGEYKLDPVRDLVPLCGNCHPMVHIAAPKHVDESKQLNAKLAASAREEARNDVTQRADANWRLTAGAWERLQALRTEAAWEQDPGSA